MVSFESDFLNEDHSMNEACEKLVHELASRVINEMNAGHSFDSGFDRVLNQKWENSMIPESYEITHVELRTAVKAEVRRLQGGNEDASASRNSWITKEMEKGAAENETKQRRILGDDYD